MNWQMRPRRVRRPELSEVVDGFIVYDEQTERLHHLNATALLVLELCDGTLFADELPGMLQAAFGLPEPPVADVEACLATLLRQGLLEEVPLAADRPPC